MIKLLSSDLNGTLVHQHTMSDMIRLYIGEQQYQQATEVFKRQASGTATMQEAFQNAGPLTKGLTLREAIEYTKVHMRYLDGFHEFVDTLAKLEIPFVINSTGYSVTINAIREQVGADKIHGHIGNFLRFGVNADANETLSEEELQRKIREYFHDPEVVNNPSYDKIQATGLIELGIVNEEAKTTLIREYVTKYFRDVQPSEITHIGDTMGDSGGILGVAKLGGLGIAFNYNQELEDFLRNKMETEDIPGKIILIDKKSEESNLKHIIPYLK